MYGISQIIHHKPKIFLERSYINPSNGNYDIFSSGHRNPQGLLVEKNLILETEHGPHGGDEINKIVFGGNYGWPIASEGDSCDFYSKNREPFYMKNHKNFTPIYSFVPSIGI